MMMMMIVIIAKVVFNDDDGGAGANIIVILNCKIRFRLVTSNLFIIVYDFNQNEYKIFIVKCIK